MTLPANAEHQERAMSTVDVFAIAFMAFIGGFVMSMQIQIYCMTREMRLMTRVMKAVGEDYP